MGLAWTPLALLGALVLAMSWTMATLILRARPDLAQNRRLALCLATLGTAHFVYAGIAPLATSAGTIRVVSLVFMGVAFFVPLVYLAFLATLDTPWSRPLRHRAAMPLLGALTFGQLAALLVAPDLFVAGVEPAASGRWAFVPGPLWALLGNLLQLLLFLYGLVVALSAFRRARSPEARRRALGYAVAFGIRDALFALLLVFLLTAGITPGSRLWWVAFAAPPLVDAFFLLLLAYAILRTQLFDLDLRLKWAAARGSVAMVGIVTVFVALKAAESYLSRELGFVAAAAAAGLLLFLAPRLNRVADRVADKAAPSVRPTSEYLTFRKFEVYRSAYEGLVGDGTLLPKERAVLDGLRAQLGISAEDASMLEAEVRGKVHPGGAQAGAT